MFLLLYLIPTIIAIAVIALLNKFSKNIKRIALIGSIIPLLLIPFMLGSIGALQNIPWFSINGYQFTLTTSLSMLNLILFAMVALIAPFVVIYSLSYMDKPLEDKRYYIEILAFEVAMLAFAISGNFILLFIAWEFLSLTSYLLIGFYDTKKSITAARNAVTTILIGDIAILGAIVLLWNSYSSFQFNVILASVQSGAISLEVQVAAILILIAAFTKSAQFPFTGWLPDAMQGPTPVSAFLHSSTMVKAGVFIVLLLFTLFVSAKLLPVILIIGVITAIISTINAMRDTNIKKVLAYSTIQELSLMFIAIGLGYPGVALFLFIVQTFYKAALFFYSGMLIKASNTEDMLEMKGRWESMYIVIAIVICAASLAGIIPFSGFFASTGIESAASSNISVYVILLLIDLFTGFFISRWVLLPLQKRQKENSNHYLSSKSMLYSFAAMAAITLASAVFIMFYSGLFSGTAQFQLQPTTLIDAILETIFASAGIISAYYIFAKNAYPWYAKKIQWKPGKDGIISLSYSYFAIFIYDISTAFSMFDSFIDNIFNSAGNAVLLSGKYLKRIQNGSINLYSLAFLIGMICLVLLIIYI
jgi:NADH-quinone oxidoreductase subunit L